MKTLKIKEIEFGNGTPKIAVPIMPHHFDEIKEEMLPLKNASYDVVEWRIDYYDDLSLEGLLKAIHEIKTLLPKGLLLGTLRTSSQGGVALISDEQYYDILNGCIESNAIDLIDLEYTAKHKKKIITNAHEHNVYVIISAHDFDKTPACKEMKKLLKRMSLTGADIVKLAVMPKDYEDVLSLMKATVKMKDTLDTPVISMSMGEIGVTSRMLVEQFGSVLTFGCVSAVSAPGQINSKELKQIINKIHKYIK